ncbi:MAG: 3-hydroxybutyryl-CoA dehydratase, partial [Deltaproteobacteria bacterium]|nr:3-hydroxybutyryl-CoA dehydratase [Deltaproteobacteria bacterium]
MTKLEAIDYSMSHRVATIALDRPEARNALNRTMRRELLHAVSSANDDSDVRTV